MKPNIIYFFCDELRTDALGIYGTPFKEIETPHIDWIGRAGTVFRNCFCNSPVCVPSRTSLLTGLYPEDTGVYCNEAAWKNYEFENCYITIPEYLKQNGYVTATFGKTHLARGMHPFDIDMEEGGEMGWGQKIAKEKGCIMPKGFTTMIGGVYEEKEEYPPNAVVKNALQWIDGQKGPYFARISFLQPHTPVFPPASYAQLYEGLPFSDAFTFSDTISRYEKRFAEECDNSNLTSKDIFHTRSYYYALVKWVDDQVGLVLNYLRDTEQIDNTILIFGADHGASLGENGCYCKHTYAPQVHRVPLLIRNPFDNVGKGEVSECCSNIDLAKTICRLVGIEPHPQFKGHDLFSGEKEQVFSTIGYGNEGAEALPNIHRGHYYEGRGWPRRGCVRTNRYRLDMNLMIDGKKCESEEDQDIFFVDYIKYPAENINMVKGPEYQQIIEELTERLLAHSFGIRE